MMRPANKAALASYLKSKVTIVTHLPDGAQYVLDGGHLIHVVVFYLYFIFRDHDVSALFQGNIAISPIHNGNGSTVVFKYAGYVQQ